VVTRCIESDTRPVLEGKKEKCYKLWMEAPVNGGSNSNCPKVAKFPDKGVVWQRCSTTQSGNTPGHPSGFQYPTLIQNGMKSKKSGRRKREALSTNLRPIHGWMENVVGGADHQQDSKLEIHRLSSPSLPRGRPFS